MNKKGFLEFFKTATEAGINVALAVEPAIDTAGAQ